jgi:hypothetical protein
MKNFLLALVYLLAAAPAALGQVATTQTATPKLTWTSTLSGYLIERSFDEKRWEFVALVGPEKSEYTDKIEKDPGGRKVCYRIVPQTSDGLNLFKKPTCITTAPLALEIILDNDVATGTTKTGKWIASSYKPPYGTTSLYADSASTFRWTPDLADLSGHTFDVFVWFTAGPNRTKTAPYAVSDAEGKITTVYVDQNNRANGGKWFPLGSFKLAAGSYVEIAATAGQVGADAVRFVKAD